MGKVIRKKIEGMKIWLKFNLVLLFTLLASVLMYQGWYNPKPVEAAISNPNPWTFVHNAVIAGTMAPNVTSTLSYTAGGTAGSGRIMLVAVSFNTTAAANMTSVVDSITATFNGVQATRIVGGDQVATVARGVVWLGYIKDAVIPTGTYNVVVNGTVTGTNVTGVRIACATFAGVDQETPFTDAKWSQSNTLLTTGTAVALNYNAGDYPFIFANNNMASSMTTVSYTPAKYTTAVKADTANGSALCANITTLPGANVTNESTNINCSTSGRIGLIAASLKLFSPTITTCGGCHGNPPVDGTARNTPIGLFQGDHGKHSGTNPGQYSKPCTICHIDNGVDLSHANGNINMANPINANTGATYSKTASFAVTNAAFTGGTCSATYCHSNGTSVATGTIPANTSLAWGVATTCASCHGAPPNYANNTPKKNSHATSSHAAMTCDKCHNTVTTDGTTINSTVNHADGTYNVVQGTGVTFTYVYNAGGGSCSSISCHANAQWGVTVLDCVTCHTAATDNADGAPTRRAIVGEFAMTWSHKRSAGGTVTKFDCCVCHLEGDVATGSPNAAFHKNNLINLRNPDTGDGTGLTAFTSFTRNTASATLETWVTNVQNNLCLKCHDAGGATSSLAWAPGGSGLRPFGVAVQNSYNQNVLDVDSMFAVTNATFHPVKGPQNNPFSNSVTLAAPWNTKAAPAAHPNQVVTDGPQISCWDCHGALLTAHGGSSTLVGTRVMQYATVLGAVGTLTDTTNLCIQCHVFNVYNSTGYTASAYGGVNSGGTGVDVPANTAVGHGERMTFTCTTCHSSSWVNPGRPFVGNDVHGYNNNAYYKPSHLITPSFTVTGTNWGTATTANLGTSNDVYATYLAATQNNLSVTNFQYLLTDIPDGVTITGIAVIVEGKGSSAIAAQRQIKLNLSKVAGTAIGTWKPAVQLGTTDTTVVFGGPTDLWGVASWTPAEIRAAGFGVLLSDNDTIADGTLSIDLVRLVVYTNRWGNSTTTSGSTLTGARPYAFLRNAAEKTSTVGQAKWQSWRPRKDGATTNTGWGCSWTTANAGAPCSRGDHVTNWISYGPGGVF